MFAAKSLLIVGLFYLCSILPDTLHAETNQNGTWTTAAPAPTQRTEVAAAALEGKIYVVGGFSKPSLQNALKFAISSEFPDLCHRRPT